MAKQTAPDNYGMTADELADANAQGMTPAEWVAAYGSKVQQAEMEAAGTEGSQAPKMTGAGMTSSADSISTQQEAKQVAKGNPTNTGMTEAQIEKEFANDPWSQLGAGLVKLNEQEEAPVEKAVSGGDTASNEKMAANTALAALGQSPGGGASQWLNSTMAKANAIDAPMEAAMKAYGQAYSAGQQGINTSLEALGQANQLGVNTAPEQTWLQDLATHIQSNLNYSGTVPEWAKDLPNALKYYLQQSGQTGGTGTVPVTSLTYPGEKNTPTGLSNPAGAAPGATSTSSALTPGGSPAAS